MAKKVVSFDEIAKGILEVIKGADKARDEQLQELLLIKEIKARDLEKEERRLAGRLGAEHETVKHLHRRLVFTKMSVKDLQLEVKRKEIPVTEPDPNAWSARGMVMDEKLKGRIGVKVAVYDAKSEFRRAISTSTTDEKGHFELKLTKEKLAALRKKKADLYIKVMDSRGKVIRTEKIDTVLEPGRDEYVEVHLRGIH